MQELRYILAGMVGICAILGIIGIICLAMAIWNGIESDNG